jgi:hypothetical protein
MFKKKYCYKMSLYIQFLDKNIYSIITLTFWISTNELKVTEHCSNSWMYMWILLQLHHTVICGSNSSINKAVDIVRINLHIFWPERIVHMNKG